MKHNVTKPGPGYGRVPDHIIEERLEQVRVWIIECYPRIKICKMGADLWDVQYRAIDEYIATAKKEISSKNRSSFDILLLEAITRQEHFINVCLKDGDKKTALQASKHLDFLNGLMIERIDVTSKGESINRIIEIVRPSKDTSE